MSDTNQPNPAPASDVNVNTPPASVEGNFKPQHKPGDALTADEVARIIAKEYGAILNTRNKPASGTELLDYLMTLPQAEGDRLAKILTLVHAQAVDPFGIVKRDIENSTNAPPVAPGSGTNAPASTNEPASNPLSLDSTPSNPGAIDIASVLSSIDAITSSTARQSGTPNAGPQPLPQPGIGFAPDANFSNAPDFNAQALQAANDRLVTTLQQNTQLTTALFERMTALMQEQNRKLAGMDQKINDLSNQIKSLKNP